MRIESDGVSEAEAVDYAYSLNQVGTLYNYGLLGEETDYELAYDYFVRAAEYGNENAQNAINDMIAEGKIEK